MEHLIFVAILLLFIAFILGCLVGAWFRKSRGDMAPATATVSRSASQPATPSPAAAAKPAPAPAPAAPPAAPVAEAAPPAPEPTPAPAPSPAPAPEPTPAPPAEEVAPVAAFAGPAIADEDRDSASKADAAGTRPSGLTEPRGGKADELTRVKGIGPVNEKRLHSLGIFHFDQIAAWGEKEIAWVNTFLTFKGRIERENWVGQAADLAKE